MNGPDSDGKEVDTAKVQHLKKKKVILRRHPLSLKYNANSDIHLSFLSVLTDNAIRLTARDKKVLGSLPDRRQDFVGVIL